MPPPLPMLPQQLAGLLIGFIYKVWSSTYRYHLILSVPGERSRFFDALMERHCLSHINLIYACFHQDDLACIPFFRDRGIGVLVSASKDGRMLAAALEHFGYQTVKGSSHRKAVSGLLAAMKMVKEGTKFTIAVDGPRGPRQEVKEGIAHLSAKTGVPIAPVRAFCHRAFVFKKSWSRTALPMPFSRVDIHVGPIGFYTTAELQACMQNLVKD